tara:strand:- start:8833 stop:9174 length:342 start_codon:yes stop_codon:yes gene_type:complete
VVHFGVEFATRLNKKPLPIYDFNLVNQYTAEPFDLINDSEPTYWWESSHYKKALGDKLIDWINATEDKRDHSIGVAITQENIDQHIETQSNLLLQWQKARPEVVKKLLDSING